MLRTGLVSGFNLRSTSLINATVDTNPKIKDRVTTKYKDFYIVIASYLGEDVFTTSDLFYRVSHQDGKPPYHTIFSHGNGQLNPVTNDNESPKQRPMKKDELVLCEDMILNSDLPLPLKKKFERILPELKKLVQ